MKTQRVSVAALAIFGLVLLLTEPATSIGQEPADTPAAPATEAAPDAETEPAPDAAAEPAPASTPPAAAAPAESVPDAEPATPPATPPAAPPVAETETQPPAVDPAATGSQPPAGNQPSDAPAPSESIPAEILNPDAADEASNWEIARLVAMLLALFIIPIVVGNFIANSLKMPDYGWKIALVIGTLAAAILAISTGEFKGGPDLSGGITLIYELVDSGGGGATTEPGQQPQASAGGRGNADMDKLIGALKERIDPSGTKEVTIRRYGDAIEIIIPRTGAEDLEYVKRNITALGQLEFRITADSRRPSDQGFIEQSLRLPPEQKILTVGGRPAAEWVGFDTNEFSDDIQNPDGIGLVKRLANGRPEALVLIDPFKVTGDHISSVSKGFGETGGSKVLFHFDSIGAELFGDLTGRNLPTSTNQYRFLGIVLDKRLLSAPSINSRITSSGEISGRGMTERDVDHIIDVLTAGKLPAELVKEPISEEVISPTLGLETIRMGALSILASLIAVLLFMAVYYRFAGVVACMALIANLVLTIGTMYLIGAAFTLPGLAGLVLTIGMSVDANVLIFERMREELDRGSALRMAIRNGFDRASTAIIDSNLTTLITGFVLYAIGTDQLRGFAVTLIIGIVMSMFTAIFCSRIVFDIAERRRWITRLQMMRILASANFDFMKWRTPAMVASLLLVGVGLVAVFQRGNDLLDIDFTGGTSVTMVLEEEAKMPLADVRRLLEDKSDLDEFNLLVVERGAGETTYTIDSSVDSVAKVELTLEDVFEGQLKTYQLEIRDVAAYTAGDATGTEATLEFGSEADPDSGITHDALLARLMIALEAAGHEGITPVLTAPGHDFGSSQKIYEWNVRLPLPVESAEPILTGLASEMNNEAIFPLANKIGGRVAGNLQRQALYATLISLVGVMGYIWLRFQNFAFSIAAVAASFHDVLVTLGMLALSSYFVEAVPTVARFLQVDSFQIGLSVLAALLTLIGYSLNDTIVTFDRVREVKGKSPKLTVDMVNLSINQTLSRTILTFFTTFLVVLILYIYGGPGIHAFAFALMVGLIAGTYSSIYIAAPILLWIAGDAETSPSGK